MVRFLMRQMLSWLIMIFLAVNFSWLLATVVLKPEAALKGRLSPTEIEATLMGLGLSEKMALQQRWLIWVSRLFRGDWGTSPTGASINSELTFRIELSAQLLLAAGVLGVGLGIFLGVIAASRHRSTTDKVLQFIAMISMNLHTIVAAMIVVIIAVGFNNAVGSTIFYVAGSRRTESSGFALDLVDRAQHLFLPALTLVILSYASYFFTQRALLIDGLSAHYVRTARGKGLTAGQAVRKHAFRMALVPMTTSIGFAVPAIFTATVLIEKIYAWHGMGEYLVLAMRDQDVNALTAVCAFGAVISAIGALASDLLSVMIDPRVRVS